MKESCVVFDCFFFFKCCDKQPNNIAAEKSHFYKRKSRVMKLKHRQGRKTELSNAVETSKTLSLVANLEKTQKTPAYWEGISLPHWQEDIEMMIPCRQKRQEMTNISCFVMRRSETTPLSGSGLPACLACLHGCRDCMSRRFLFSLPVGWLQRVQFVLLFCLIFAFGWFM